MPLNDCRIIELPKITDIRGNLSFIEGGRHIPFEIKRVYYLYNEKYSDRSLRLNKERLALFIVI